jgi:hypothetical protein
MVDRREKAVAARRQDDIEADHRGLGDRHRGEKAREMRMQQRDRLAHRLEIRLVQADQHHVVRRGARKILAQEALLRVHHFQVERSGQAPVRRRGGSRQHHEVGGRHDRATAAYPNRHFEIPLREL